MAAIKPNSASADSTDIFTPKEAQLLGYILLNNKNKLDVDWEKIATLMNYKKGKVVSERFRQIAKKYVAATGENAGGEGENGTEGKPDGITDGAVKAAPAVEDTKKPRTQRKRKAAEDGVAGEESQIPKKRVKKDTATKVNVKVINEPKVKEEANIKGEADEYDEPSHNIEAEVEASEPEEAEDV